ncbi:MAG: hypothetical protein ACRD1L_01615 [Terriglobales bacterium]
MERAAKRAMEGWRPDARDVALRQEAGRMARVEPLLRDLIEALGSNGTARLLDADRGQVSRWNSGAETISAGMARRIVDLHDVLSRILRLYQPRVAAAWLVGSEPLLRGARPIDILALEGVAPVIEAIDGIAAGVFA